MLNSFDLGTSPPDNHHANLRLQTLSINLKVKPRSCFPLGFLARHHQSLSELFRLPKIVKTARTTKNARARGPVGLETIY